MHIYTCSFQAFSPDTGVPVRISLGNPQWRLPYPLRHKAIALAPARNYFDADRGAFTPRYREQLDRHGPDLIWELFDAISQMERDPRLVLLCGCDLAAPGGWCHRRLFAQWWAERTGGLVDELADTPHGAEPRHAAVQALSRSSR